MSFVQSAILVVVFAVLFRYVVPLLFPSVVNGALLVDSAAVAKRRQQYDAKHNKDGGRNDRSDGASVFDDAFVVSGGGIGFVNNHRTQAKAQLRRRQADEGKGNMV